MQRAYISLGSNLQDPLMQVKSAITELAQIPDSHLVSISSLYRSAPLAGEGVPDEQPDYINAVAALDTDLSPLQLLQALQAIEQRHGRQRSGARWAPRTLDLDLLLYGQEIINSEPLTIPHPGLVDRNFVLYPLLEIAPELILPQHGALAQAAARLSRQGLQQLPEKGNSILK
jgi:2-amino-4-hydroxy-6-hydroxymethyldihydropteridine diphosphokinase